MEDLQMNYEREQMNSQNTYALSKQRQEEKRKIAEAIYLSKMEEAKQAKFQKQQNEQKKRSITMKIEQDNKIKNQ